MPPITFKISSGKLSNPVRAMSDFAMDDDDDGDEMSSLAMSPIPASDESDMSVKGERARER
jgi:hypothetical protein